MKSIFKTKLTVNELQGKIEELTQRESDLQNELVQIRNNHAEALATGGDLKETKKRIFEINLDLESLPESIRIVEEEVERVQADNQVEKINTFKVKILKEKPQIRSNLDSIYSQSAKLYKTIQIYEDTMEGLSKEAISLGVRTSAHSHINIGNALNGAAVHGSIQTSIDTANNEIIMNFEGVLERLEIDINSEIHSLRS